MHFIIVNINRQPLCENLPLLCSIRVDLKQVSGNVSDIVKETVNWLQSYFSAGVAENLPTICALSDANCGKRLFLCVRPSFTQSLLHLQNEWVAIFSDNSPVNR